MIDLSNLLPYDSGNCRSYELIMWPTSLSPLGVFVLVLWPPQMVVMPVVAAGVHKMLKIPVATNGAN
jgi:hypothetical protein